MIQAFAYQDARGAIVPTKDTKEQGDDVVHATTGEKLKRIVTKMSKRYGNVVNPDDVVAEYGADTLRLYEMYMGPLADSKPWNPKDVPGVHRFLQRSWRLCVPEFAENGTLHAHLRSDRADDPEIEKALHRTIHKVDGDIERMAFNTAIAAMMIFVNEATKAMDQPVAQPDAAVRADPAAVRAARRRGAVGAARRQGLLAYASGRRSIPRCWSTTKSRSPCRCSARCAAARWCRTNATNDVVLAAARAAVASYLEGKTVVKEIVVPKKLVNFVVK
jgi:leucyl-tRNA synthetase